MYCINNIGFELGNVTFRVPLVDLACGEPGHVSDNCYSGVQSGQNDETGLPWVLGTFSSRRTTVSSHQVRHLRSEWPTVNWSLLIAEAAGSFIIPPSYYCYPGQKFITSRLHPSIQLTLRPCLLACFLGGNDGIWGGSTLCCRTCLTKMMRHLERTQTLNLSRSQSATRSTKFTPAHATKVKRREKRVLSRWER